MQAFHPVTSNGQTCCELWCFIETKGKQGTLLLLGHTDSATTAAGGLCVLTANTQTAKRRKRGHQLRHRVFNSVKIQHSTHNLSPADSGFISPTCYWNSLFTLDQFHVQVWALLLPSLLRLLRYKLKIQFYLLSTRFKYYINIFKPENHKYLLYQTTHGDNWRSLLSEN